MKTNCICKLKDVYKALYDFEKEFTSRYGLRINEAMILCCMQDEKPKSANELCDFIGLSNSRVSRVIQTVEKKGYISREVGAIDKRQMIFSLTDLGEEKVNEMAEKKIDFTELGALFFKLMGG